MSHLNKFFGQGNLARDVELRYTPKGTAIAQLTICSNRTWSNESGQKQEDTAFIDVTAFGKRAEIIGQYFKKGSQIMVEGRLKTDTWDDRQTGQKRSKLGVILENFFFVGTRETANDDTERQALQDRRQQGAAPPPEDDDVPF
jgi:single-strand DNA-binding protein